MRFRTRSFSGRQRHECNITFSQLSNVLLRAQNLPFLSFYSQNMTLSTLLILEVCRTRVIYELHIRSCSPYSLCGSVAQLQSIGARNPKVEARFFMGTLFLCPTRVTRRKTSLSIFFTIYNNFFLLSVWKNAKLFVPDSPLWLMDVSNASEVRSTSKPSLVRDTLCWQEWAAIHRIPDR